MVEDLFSGLLEVLLEALFEILVEVLGAVIQFVGEVLGRTLEGAADWVSGVLGRGDTNRGDGAVERYKFLPDDREV